MYIAVNIHHAYIHYSDTSNAITWNRNRQRKTPTFFARFRFW